MPNQNPNLVEADASPLYLLTYDHGGIVLWGEAHFLKCLRDAVAWLDRYPGFKIGLDNEAFTYDYLAEHAPEILDELRDDLRQRYAGRLGLGTCTYGQPLSQFINEESNIRQIAYALEADQHHLGSRPFIYLMSEHAMHSQIPQILLGFGFTGAILRTHFKMYGYNPAYDFPIGWWVGLDGSRLPAIPTYPEVGVPAVALGSDDGTEFGRTTLDDWILTRYPSQECRISLEDFRAKFSGIRPLLASRADDSSLRREELVKEYEGQPGYQWILLEELLSHFPPPTETMQTQPNDFKVRMPWGYCGNEIWNRSREAEVAVLTAERLAAMELLLGGADHEPELRQAWKTLLIAQHHDIQICGLLTEARAFLAASVLASTQVAQASLQSVASRLQSGGLTQLTFFNPHSWPRKEWLTVDVSLPRGAAKNLEGRSGAEVIPTVISPTQWYSNGTIKQTRVAVYAELPALGFRSYALVAATEQAARPPLGIDFDPATLRLTTPHWEVALDPEGGIRSLKDRRSGESLLKPGSRSGFFAGRIDGQECESNGRWLLQSAPSGTPGVIAREQGALGSIPYLLELAFRAEIPRIDCRVTFQFAYQKIGRLSENPRDATSAFIHEEKLRFKFFPAVGDQAMGVRDLPFAIAETPERYIEGNYWTALTDGRTGLAIFNRGTMGLVREPDGGVSIPLAYASHYIWGTRMLDGDFTYEFALYPFRGDWRESDLHRQALNYNFPCPGLQAASGDGSCGDEVRLFDVSGEGVLLSALYSTGGQVYARLFESRGQSGQCLFKYLPGLARWLEVELNGDMRGAASQPLVFRPWEIKTLRVELQK